MLETEQDVIQKIKSGDHNAMEFIFKKHVEAAVRLAYLITRDWATAEDAVQESFIQAFRSINTFKDGLPFKPWFTRIVVNKAKRIKDKFGTDKQIPASQLILVDDSTSPEELSIAKEHQATLYKAINQLDENHRLPVILMYLNELSEKEIATILDIPVTTVKSRLYTARQRLRKYLSNNNKGGVPDGK